MVQYTRHRLKQTEYRTYTWYIIRSRVACRSDVWLYGSGQPQCRYAELKHIAKIIHLYKALRVASGPACYSRSQRKMGRNEMVSIILGVNRRLANAKSAMLQENNPDPACMYVRTHLHTYFDTSHEQKSKRSTAQHGSAPHGRARSPHGLLRCADSAELGVLFW